MKIFVSEKKIAFYNFCWRDFFFLSFLEKRKKISYRSFFFILNFIKVGDLSFSE